MRKIEEIGLSKKVQKHIVCDSVSKNVTISILSHIGLKGNQFHNKLSKRLLIFNTPFDQACVGRGVDKNKSDLLPRWRPLCFCPTITKHRLFWSYTIYCFRKHNQSFVFFWFDKDENNVGGNNSFFLCHKLLSL